MPYFSHGVWNFSRAGNATNCKTRVSFFRGFTVAFATVFIAGFVALYRDFATVFIAVFTAILFENNYKRAVADRYFGKILDKFIRNAYRKAVFYSCSAKRKFHAF